MNRYSFTPLDDHLIVETITDNIDKTSGGIFIPDNVARRQTLMGRVIAMGPGAKQVHVTQGGDVHHGRQPWGDGIHVGAIVAYGRFAGTELITHFGATPLVCLRESELLSVVQRVEGEENAG